MPHTDIRDELRVRGYALLPARQLSIAPELRPRVAELAREWEHLGADRYLRNGARFRERAYDRFFFLPRTGEVRLHPHRPYFQSEGANGYAGGIQRDVAPLSRSTVDNPLLTRLLRDDFARFPVEDGRLDEPWDVQCHQFRIIGTPEELGEPTPEGPHRDEVDYGAIHLMGRLNVTGGESQVYSEGEELLAEFCLRDRMDTMFWADRKILHAVRPVGARDESRPAVRDVLILGYTHAPGQRRTDPVHGGG
ncbi:2OG-Fe dioxygenase family protein [Streptomyces sp. LaBMicrA B280]|uniref:2OG-Fe dioxygenase family protein n=1 Tax=Streptomyces sp. LaBMicrA B280 TaxID=3391001 RepID=UPI003BA75710